MGGISPVCRAKDQGRLTNTSKKGIPKKYQDQHRTKEKAHEGNQFHPNRRIIMVLRESFGVKGEGASKTVVAVCKSENQADIDALVKKYVEKQSTLRTDELSAYANVKLMGYTHETVNHSVEFVGKNGENQNQAESYFSRMRRAAIGIYHRITPRNTWSTMHRRLPGARISDEPTRESSLASWSNPPSGPGSRSTGATTAWEISGRQKSYLSVHDHVAAIDMLAERVDFSIEDRHI